eukprot:34406-Rhodomonas_salina.3
MDKLQSVPGLSLSLSLSLSSCTTSLRYLPKLSPYAISLCPMLSHLPTRSPICLQPLSPYAISLRDLLLSACLPMQSPYANPLSASSPWSLSPPTLPPPYAIYVISLCPMLPLSLSLSLSLCVRAEVKDVVRGRMGLVARQDAAALDSNAVSATHTDTHT